MTIYILDRNPRLSVSYLDDESLTLMIEKIRDILDKKYEVLEPWIDFIINKPYFLNKLRRYFWYSLVEKKFRENNIKRDPLEKIPSFLFHEINLPCDIPEKYRIYETHSIKISLRSSGEIDETGILNVIFSYRNFYEVYLNRKPNAEWTRRKRPVFEYITYYNSSSNDIVKFPNLDSKIDVS